MDDPQIIKELFNLADGLSGLAEAVRQASLPHHLNKSRTRLLHHLADLNKLRDHWGDTHKPTRRKKPWKPMIGPYDKLSHWNSPFRYGKSKND